MLGIKYNVDVSFQNLLFHTIKLTIRKLINM